ncbi:MAG: 4Fe-4S dicluster domain-containing protein [Candidatus Thorarchaeota archaeon]
MPIDRDYRTTWSIQTHHKSHPVWEGPAETDGTIHGDIVGVHLESCVGCMKCIEACPTDVFDYWTTDKWGVVVDPAREVDCIICLVCELVCPTDAIHVKGEGGSDDTLDSLLRGA